MRYKKPLILLFLSIFTLGALFASYKTIVKRKPQKQIDIIGVGFPRSGTSIFFDELGALPHVNRMYRLYDVEHKIKGFEVNFFGELSAKSSITLRQTENYRKKVFKPPSKYYDYLLSDQKINAEKSPHYIWKESTIKEISAFNPNVKIVVNVREPVEWVWSYYKHCTEGNRFGASETDSFESFFEHIQPQAQLSTKNCAIYSNFIKTLYKYFPKENIYIVPFEELKDLRTGFDLCDLLNLQKPDAQSAQTSFRKVPSYREEMGPELYDKLSDFYRPHTEEFFQLIGREIESWGNEYQNNHTQSGAIMPYSISDADFPANVSEDDDRVAL